MLVFAERYMSECPRCGRPIALPHRSPLGTFEGQPDQPAPAGLINILCIERGQVFEYPLGAFHRNHVPTQGRNPQTDVTWWIESPCAHESCPNSYSIFAWYRGDVSEEEILNKATHAIPKKLCVGHEFGWSNAKATVKKFDIW